ncbi:hypothetical protein GH714_019074 [Hevea brasiliensis]|uniref:Uncharacterized protein n=1 Tax=Hevea brasiliensis TaxID=3981 RepID=A0A6A6LD37_HEVBR|nr:hypothetical protein GH714_019074 [Hevea brasiliensis]
MHDDSLTMEFDGEICRFNIFDAMRYPSDVHSVCHLDVIDDYIDEIFELGDEVTLKVDLCHDLRKEDITNSKVDLAMSKDLEKIVMELHNLHLLRYVYLVSMRHYLSLYLRNSP